MRSFARRPARAGENEQLINISFCARAPETFNGDSWGLLRGCIQQPSNPSPPLAESKHKHLLLASSGEGKGKSPRTMANFVRSMAHECGWYGSQHIEGAGVCGGHGMHHCRPDMPLVKREVVRMEYQFPIYTTLAPRPKGESPETQQSSILRTDRACPATGLPLHPERQGRGRRDQIDSPEVRQVYQVWSKALL